MFSGTNIMLKYMEHYFHVLLHPKTLPTFSEYRDGVQDGMFWRKYYYASIYVTSFCKVHAKW